MNVNGARNAQAHAPKHGHTERWAGGSTASLRSDPPLWFFYVADSLIVVDVVVMRVCVCVCVVEELSASIKKCGKEEKR